jgi:hypothetical protein
MFDYSTFYEGSSIPGVTISLFIVYSLLSAVLLVNLLVAAMASAFQQHSEDTGLRLLLYKAQICDEMETVVPRWVRGGKRRRDEGEEGERVGERGRERLGPGLYIIMC